MRGQRQPRRIGRFRFVLRMPVELFGEDAVNRLFDAL
jgi:hypothetical protein